MAISETRKRIMKIRTKLVLDEPFFGILALKLRIYEAFDRPTAWTDGTSIGFNPKFVESLSDKQLETLIAHEVLHCALGHMWRRDAREMKRWNYATDFVINLSLVDAGFTPLDNWLLDEQWRGKGAEYVYERIPQPPAGNGSGSPTDEVLDAPPWGESEGDGEGEERLTEADWKVAVQQAATMARMAGKLPAGMERFVKEAANPAVDWKSALRRFVQTAAKNDYTWVRPNRRYMAHGLYLPSLHSEEIGPLVVVYDTSGSVDGITQAQFNGEINSIVADVNPKEVHVWYCDTKIQRKEVFLPGDPITLHPMGGGGTDFRPPFHELAKGEVEPVCLIYLTDMYGPFPDATPGIPVLWASIVDGIDAPFGEVLHINV